VFDKCRDDSTGAGWLLFAMLMLTISVLAFSIAYFCAHLWLIANIGLRLMEKQWFRATWWASVLALLIYIDVQAYAS
jgi:hypothetical protein